MFLALQAQISPGQDLGYLLHKHPDAHYQQESSLGLAHVFYPEVLADSATAVLMLEVDTIGSLRSKRKQHLGMEQYINDRPYVAGSLLSVAIAQHLGSALNGHSRERPERVDEALPLTLTLAAVASRGGPEWFQTLFEPLGYQWQVERYAYPGVQSTSDIDKSPESPYYTLTLKHCLPLNQALSHLYVLLPVLDRHKHYFYGPDEVDKLLRHGQGWLEKHPAQEQIAQRYLAHRRSFATDALQQLMAEPTPAPDHSSRESQLEAPLTLNQLRIQAIVDFINSKNPHRVIDLGCGEGRILEAILKQTHTPQVIGVDVSPQELERAEKRLKLEWMTESQLERLKLYQSSALYRDQRLAGADCLLLIEVIEHLESYQLERLARVVFGESAAQNILITTPNRDYNSVFGMAINQLRHPDHRFEWSQSEFKDWCQQQAERYGYTLQIDGIGPQDPESGHPTQSACFSKESSHV